MKAAPPMPKSPPKYPDFCGRRRLQLEVQVLNREIGFLQEELQSLEGAQPASRCCKEVNEFVGANPDPLIPIKKKRHNSCRIWKWLRSTLCFIPSLICCPGECSLGLGSPSCCCRCKFPACKCCSCTKCGWPSCSYCCSNVSCCRLRRCWSEASCCKPRCCRPKCCCKGGCCCLRGLSCPGYSCGCVWSCPRCSGVQLCPSCTKSSCISGCEC